MPEVDFLDGGGSTDTLDDVTTRGNVTGNTVEVARLDLPNQLDPATKTKLLGAIADEDIPIYFPATRPLQPELLSIDEWGVMAVETGKLAQLHNRQHSITSASDHTSAATSGQMLKADANGLPVNASNTDAQVSAAVTASHARQHAINSASDHTGYGDCVTKNVGTTAGTVAAGDHTHSGTWNGILVGSENTIVSENDGAQVLDLTTAFSHYIDVNYNNTTVFTATNITNGMIVCLKVKNSDASSRNMQFSTGFKNISTPLVASGTYRELFLVGVGGVWVGLALTAGIT